MNTFIQFFTNEIYHIPTIKGYAVLSLFHRMYLYLNVSGLGALLTDSGRLFHILGPE